MLEKLKTKKGAVLTGIVALFTAAGVAVSGSVNSPAALMPGEEVSPRVAAIDRTDMSDGVEDTVPDEDDDEEEDEEKKRLSPRRRILFFPGIAKALAAVLGALGLKKLAKKPVFWAGLAAVVLLIAADAALTVFVPEYREIRPQALTLAAICLLTGFGGGMLIRRALRKRREDAVPAAEPEDVPAPVPDSVTFIDAGGEFTVKL